MIYIEQNNDVGNTRVAEQKIRVSLAMPCQ